MAVISKAQLYGDLLPKLNESFGLDAPKHYILNSDYSVSVTEDSTEAWKDWSNETRRIALDKISGKGFVSTIWLVMSHSISDVDPLLFETLVKSEDEVTLNHMDRYSTYEQAWNGHKALVDRLMKWDGKGDF
ncbi:unnamed protein product [marine sediment metagenome]|uniref:Uncharacterized protein n=1 Tax=marine sediment metagenome TaxID=412755 RepID=X0T2Y3_9ZZZZ